MKILLTESNGKIWALDPKTMFWLTNIPVPAQCCSRNIESNYPRGAIYWDSWGDARRELYQHEIVMGDDSLPVHPIDLPAKDMTIRQVYKCSAMQQLITAQLDTYDKKDNPSVILAKAAGRVADAMIAEDRRHEESK